jgi:CheY-like chemotaxis protein
MVATAEIEQAVGASAEFNIDGLVAKPLTPSSLRKAVANALHSNVKEMGVNVRVSAKPLAGLHLLVAEDNALNQEVIEQILINAGAQVSLVGNGQLAVEALQATGVHFDAVLMDVQMPVMDGYAATKVIRDTLGLKDLPIIALTAHARPQDRETSRLSGMSGHLVKPLDVEELHAIVAKLVGLRTASSQIAASETPRADLNVPGLNLAEALKMFGGHHARYGQLLNKFVSHHGNDVVEARRQFSTGNLERPMSLLHDLSGVAGLLQAPELSRLAAAAESALLDGKTDNLLVLFDQLQAAMDTVSVSTQQFFGEAIV